MLHKWKYAAEYVAEDPRADFVQPLTTSMAVTVLTILYSFASNNPNRSAAA